MIRIGKKESERRRRCLSVPYMWGAWGLLNALLVLAEDTQLRIRPADIGPLNDRSEVMRAVAASAVVVAS
jgi:hypothetical protein